MARPRSDIAERITRAAAEHFLAAGVDGASLRAIASSAKTSIGMVYYYFPNKDDLFLAVVEETYSKIVGSMAQALATDVSVEERLERFFARLGALSEEELRVMRLVVCEALRSSTRLDRLVARFQRGHIALVARTVVEGLSDGTLDPNRHPLVHMLSIFGLAALPQVVRRFAGDRLPFAGAPAAADLSRELVDVLLHGVGAAASAHGSRAR